MTSQISDLADFGWNSFFDSQLEPDDLVATVPVRVMAVYRGGLSVAGPGVDRLIPPFVGTARDEEAVPTVGDWLLLDRETFRPRRLLQRKSLFKRRAAGTGRKLQLIAANVDTLFIVSSCNQDFNTARLERYLALAREAEVTPVIVLTKADLTDLPEDFARAAAKLLPGLLVEVLDARDPDSVACLADWCARGETVALVGSSGVGKSTLINTLSGANRIATQSIREDDDKGRHTTSARVLHRLPAGGWLLDTPGMRELQLTDVKTGLEEVFADVVVLARMCRFADCRHEAEPGCAVLAAVDAGTLDAERLKRWRKLAAEEARNTENLAERRARDRAFGKMVKGVMRDKRQQDGE
ncbi:ribosome small subunit-dependent GTPase A [Pelagibius litoralis]|uniref:Small ribosomal subunit biogenesis GTPase RsgA n=1 Tax=Pelagibius litoralis TaxID=374515 RepID=A0A967EZ34_9PROT|nr:ribosome small subunit-dependent GTPase A [Pelagibius litoralis]